MKIQRLSLECEKAFAVAKKNHWKFREHGYAKGMISSPTYMHGWWMIPIDEDSTIPKDGLNRISTLKSNGVGIQGVVVNHEAPALLASPSAKQVTNSQRVTSRQNVDYLKGLETAVVVALTVVTGIATFFGYLFMTALMIDPVLIVVLEDGTWIEVMRWYD